MNTRIYRVTDRETLQVRLVEAAIAAQAIRHVASQTYDVAVATPKAVAQFMGGGVRVELAKPQQLTLEGEAS